MGLKVKNHISHEVTVDKIKDGDIALIESWGIKQYVGKIIIRHNNIFISIGEPSMWWDNIDDLAKNPNNRVRILPKGTEFILE